jgi:dipeptidyl aminopeptidase/acylaminoacyl peptidase
MTFLTRGRALPIATAIAAMLLALATPILDAQTPAKRLITETDLFAFVWIADPQISPDGSHVVFVQVAVNEKKDGYDSALWIVSERQRGALPATQAPQDLPRWSPDGSRLAFLRPVDRTAGGRHRSTC